MPTYKAVFRGDYGFATKYFTAKTPNSAMKLARAFYDLHATDLQFEPYDGADNYPVDEIAITDKAGNELVCWLDANLRRQLAANDLLDALIRCTAQLEHYVDSCESGKDEDAKDALSEAHEVIREARGCP